MDNQAKYRPLTANEFPCIPDYEGVLEMLQRYSFFAFSGTDGCLCGDAVLRGISLHVHCRKSSGGLPLSYQHLEPCSVVRVGSSYIQSPYRRLIGIGCEMARQVLDEEGHLPVVVRFCDWKYDIECICCYCGEPRSNQSGYLCDDCLVATDPFGVQVSADYDLPPDWNEVFRNS